MPDECFPSDMDIAILAVPHGGELYRKAVELRSRHLREPLGLSFTFQELEAEAAAFHMVAARGHDVVGNVTLVPYKKNTLKLRQMVVDPALHGQNLGRKLVEAAEQLARDNGFHGIELNARDTAVGFYRKCGYEACGDPFVELSIPHRLMKKCLAAASAN